MADGHLYVPSEGNSLIAVTVEDGDEKWSESNVSDLSSPAVANGQICIGGQDGSLVSFGARTGEKKWQFEAGDFTRANVSITDQFVYALSGDGYLYAISAGDGALAWKLDVRSDDTTHISDYWGPRPVVVNEMVFAVAGDVLIAAVGS
jgi:outer membrane protein assembly factor BamB